MVNEEEEGSIDCEGHRHRVGCNTNCSRGCCGGAQLIHLYPGLVQHLHNVMLICITTRSYIARSVMLKTNLPLSL